MMKAVITAAVVVAIVLKHVSLCSSDRPWDFSHPTSASQVTATRPSFWFDTRSWPMTQAVLRQMCVSRSNQAGHGLLRPSVTMVVYWAVQVPPVPRHVRLWLAGLTAFAPETWEEKTPFPSQGSVLCFRSGFFFSLNKNRGKCVLYNRRVRRAGTPASCPEETRKQKVLVTQLNERGRKYVNQRDWARGGREGDEKSIHKVWFIWKGKSHATRLGFVLAVLSWSLEPLSSQGWLSHYFTPSTKSSCFACPSL